MKRVGGKKGIKPSLLNNASRLYDPCKLQFSFWLTLDLWIADDRADLSQGLLAGLLHFHMGVGQHLCELGDDAGQA